MTYKRTLFSRLTSTLLALALLLTMLPLTGGKVSAVIETEDIVSRVADPSTLDGYKAYFALEGELNTQNAGGVWLDKSVLTDNAAFAGVGITKDDDNGFLVALSTMAANMSVVGMSSVPTDSILILDVSGSMDENRNNVAEDLVDAANASLKTLLEANANNRVGVVLYSGSTSSSTNANAAVTLLPLNRYETAADGVFLTYSNNDSETIGIDWDVLYENTTTRPTRQSKNVTGATYIQKGVLGALEQFLADSNTVTITDPTLGVIRRKPVVVLMSDGAPTLADTDFTNPQQYDLGNGSNTSAALSFVTQLTLAYARHQIEEKYGAEPLFYTLGLAVGGNENALSVLDPANSSTAINNFWDQYNSESVGGDILVQSGGRYSSDKVVTKIATQLEKNYVDKYFNADSTQGTLADALKNAFADIMQTIQIQSGYFPTLISGSEELSGYVSFVDRIGHGMSVTDVKGILIGDHLFSGADLASNFVPSGGALGTPTNPSALGREMVASVQTRLGIEDIDVAEALIALAYQYGQLHYENANNYSNYIGWYANKDGKFLGFYNEGTTVLPAPTGDEDTDPVFTVKSYGYLGEVDEAHGVAKSDMMYATVQIRKNIANGDEIVTFAAPAALIPTLTYNVELDEEGKLDDLTVSGAQKPIRLVYEVALDAHLNLYNLREYLGEEYLSEPHHVGTDGSVYFFTNKWDHHNVTGYGTNNTYAYFNPSRQNDKYYYLEDTPIYADQNGTLYTGDAQPSGTLYRKYTVYAKNGSALTTRTLYRTVSSAVLATAKRAGDNSWYVPKGDVHTNLDGYTVYKGGLAQEDASKNLTQTLSQAVVPFVDTKNHSVNDPGYQFYVGASLGNNGKLVIMPETGLKLTKEMADPNSDVEQAFLFVLTNDSVADDNTTYPALMVDADGNETETDVKFTNGTAAVALRPGYTLYIGGMTAGHVIGVEEQNTLYYIPHYEGVSAQGKVTITSGNMAHVNVTNEVRGVGNLTITKEIAHNLGANYEIPADKSFTFRVKLTGEHAQNATFRAEHTNGSVTEIVVVNGEFTVTLKNNESLEVFDLPEGTGVEVTEINTPAGFDATYMDNGAAGDGKVQIEKNVTATVVATNTYTPAEVYPINISVSGTKTIDGRPWQSGDSFEFQLQELIGPNNWQKLGDSVYATDIKQDFTFDHIFDNESYTTPGTYYYRIVEVEPQTPLGGVTYDKTVHSFYVVVSDSEMDGQLEISKVDSDRDTTQVVGDEQTGWTVTANFTNNYSTTGSTTVTVDVNKRIDNRGGAEKHLAGYQFGLYQYDPATGQAAGNPIQELTTTERGFARFVMTYVAAGEYTYILKEIVPAAIPAGWTYSTEEVKLTVKVTDNGDGTLSSIIYIGDEAPANATNSVETHFTNIYAPEKATLAVDFVKKTVNGQAPGNRTFTFEIRDANGKVLEGTNDENGNVSFNGSLEFTKVGIYHYSIVETSQDGNGITTDKTAYTFLVTVTDDENGKLQATYTIENVPGNTVTINNIYTARPAVYAISGKKNLTGRPLLNDEFAFVLKEVSVNGTAVSDPATYEAKNFMDGSFRFPEYTYRAEGVYVYEVREKQAEGETLGITYDGSVYTVTVTVTDNGNGNLVATAAYAKGDTSENALVFNNKYVAKGTSVEFTGDKELTGKLNNVLEGDEFQFELYKSNANWDLGTLVETVSNGPGGAFKFNKINFEKAEDQRFIVKEKNGGQTINGVTYDDTVYHVYVKVTDDLKGQLHTTVNIFNSDGVPQDSIQFTNIYATTGIATVTVEANKTIASPSDAAKTKDGFVFGIYDQNGDLVGSTQTTNLQGVAAFTLRYTEANVGATYTYTLKEIAPTAIPAGWTYSTEEVKLTVKVIDNGDGTISASIYTGEEEPAEATTSVKAYFTNTYAPEKATLAVDFVKKTVNGQAPGNRTFTFEVRDANGAVLTGTNNADGKVTFSGNLEFTKVGNYRYTVVETSQDGNGITTDKTAYTFLVTVTDDGTGVLKATYTLENSTGSEIVINNTYATAPVDYAVSGKKELTGRDLVKGEFTFVLKEVAVNGTPVENPGTYEAQNLQDGTFTFPAYTYRTAGVYTYEITEKKAEGETFGITYDGSIYTVTVTVTDNGNGNLVATAAYAKGNAQVAEVVFANTYKAEGTSVELTGSKNLSGKNDNTLSGNEFQFELYKSDANWTLGDLIQTVANDAEGNFRFAKMDVETVEDLYFIVREKNGGQTINGVTYDTTEFRVQVKVTDDLKGKLQAVVTITDGSGASKEAIRFANIYQVSGTDTVTLSGTKELTGRQWKETDAFTFNLFAADENFAYTAGAENLAASAVVKQSTADHRYTINLEYTAQDVGSTFYYVLVEDSSNAIAGVIYDETAYYITVKVQDNNEGGIKTTVSVKDATEQTLNFVNSYKAAPADVIIEGEKELTGRALVAGEFRFLAYQANGNFEVAAGAQPFAAVNDADGNFAFAFRATQAGVYNFVIYEDTSVSARLVTFDRTVYWVSVEVTDANGQLVASAPVITLAESTDTVDGILFRNAYNKNIPQTGDDTNLALWASLMAFSVVAAGALLVFEKRRKQA